MRTKRYGQATQSSVLAENVTTETTGGLDGLFTATFDFLCPNCGRRHWASETAMAKFDYVSWRLSCGWVSVRMPRAATPARDELAIYGGAVR